MVFPWSNSLLQLPSMQKRMASLVALLAVAGCQQPVPHTPTSLGSPHDDSVEDVVAAPDVLTLIYSR